MDKLSFAEVVPRKKWDTEERREKERGNWIRLVVNRNSSDLRWLNRSILMSWMRAESKEEWLRVVNIKASDQTVRVTEVRDGSLIGQKKTVVEKWLLNEKRKDVREPSPTREKDNLYKRPGGVRDK
ncbi:hypothetical protein Q3G72_007975 [Acer saccharum]|nr:hypothetical protein Q3G72_007975 [Acer saccharum]